MHVEQKTVIYSVSYDCQFQYAYLIIIVAGVGVFPIIAP